MSEKAGKTLKKQHPNACGTLNSTKHQKPKTKTSQKPLRGQTQLTNIFQRAWNHQPEVISSGKHSRGKYVPCPLDDLLGERWGISLVWLIWVGYQRVTVSNEVVIARFSDRLYMDDFSDCRENITILLWNLLVVWSWKFLQGHANSLH